MLVCVKSWLLACYLGLALVSLASCAPGSGIFSGNTVWQASTIPDHAIRALAVDPNNVQNVYVGSAHGTVFVSTDGGTQWTARASGLPLSNEIFQLAFDDSGKHLYAATAHGLFVSADAARDWRLIALSRERVTALAFDLNAPNTIFVGTNGEGAFISTDAGTSWIAIDAGLPQQVAINALIYDTDARQLWAATSRGIYRSDNRGTDWQPYDTGLPDVLAVNTILPLSPAGGTRGLVYAGTARGLFQSRDGGQHWSRGQDTFAALAIQSSLVDFRTANAQTLYFGSNGGVFRSTDGGKSWDPLASGLPRSNQVYALAIGAGNNTQLFAAANTLYLYPGSTGNLSFGQFVAIAIIFGFFFFLTRLPARARRRQTLSGPRQRLVPPTPGPQPPPPSEAN